MVDSIKRESVEGFLQKVHCSLWMRGDGTNSICQHYRGVDEIVFMLI